MCTFSASASHAFAYSFRQHGWNIAVEANAEMFKDTLTKLSSYNLVRYFEYPVLFQMPSIAVSNALR